MKLSLFKLILRNIWYFRKKHFAVFFGTVLSTAILTGALIIGDSVKYSLGSLVEKRLGNIEFSMETGDRFVTNKLSQRLSESLNVNSASLLIQKGIAIEPNTSKRVNNTHIIGLDKNFWSLSNLDFDELKEDEAIINVDIAERLGLQKGDDFLVRVEKANFIPSNAPFVKEEESSIALRLSVKEIADNHHMGRFSLQNNQSAPYNVFVSKDYLGEQMELKTYSNVIVLANNKEKGLTLERINSALKNVWTLRDAELEVDYLKNTDQFEVKTKRIFIEPILAKKLKQIEPETEEVFSYLVNTLKYENLESPYSFASATSFLNNVLKDDEAIINDWLAEDLKIDIGDQLNIYYYVIGPMRRLKEVSTSFTVKKIIKTGLRKYDKTLVPNFPGLSDANSCNEWDTGIPIDLERIRNKDEAYWDRYNGTPKMIINYNKAQEIWSNRFGNHTSLRFKANNKSLEDFNKDVIESIQPKDLNLTFIPTRKIGENAVNNAVSFGELFLSLSFFVIVASILLTALLYSLCLNARQQEFGILAAIGFSKRRILKIQLLESLFITILGGLFGVLLGIYYNYGLMKAINSIWIDIVRTNDLEIFLLPKTLIIGALSGMIISLLIMFFTNRKMLKGPIIALIKTLIHIEKKPKERKTLSMIIIIIGTISLLGLLAFSFMDKDKDVSPGNFMTAGALFILIAYFSIKQYLNHLKKKEYKLFRIRLLILKNAALNQSRSLAVIFLLALGTFTIVITSANRKTFYGAEQDAKSGTGGYLYWVQSTIPILHDLNASISDSDRKEYFKNGNVSFVQFHRLQGDDASCLNLNQVNKPQILGIDVQAFDQKQAFSFASLDDKINKNDVWKALDKELGENCIPAYADQTVITWSLKKKLGDTLTYLNEAGNQVYMILKGGLNPSIFQGHLLISDKHFTKYFPSVSGSKVLLVEAPLKEEYNIQRFFKENYLDYGIDIQKASDRLAEFNSVTNTYLFIFMILGGLGVLIGTIGLGIVLLRNILDRKKEIAILQAVGFVKKRILKILFFENFILLITGVSIGIVAACIGILPSILSPSFDMQIEFVMAIIMGVLFNGVCWIYFTAKFQVKKIFIHELQGE